MHPYPDKTSEALEIHILESLASPTGRLYPNRKRFVPGHQKIVPGQKWGCTRTRRGRRYRSTPSRTGHPLQEKGYTQTGRRLLANTKRVCTRIFFVPESSRFVPESLGPLRLVRTEEGLYPNKKREALEIHSLDRRTSPSTPAVVVDHPFAIAT